MDYNAINISVETFCVLICLILIVFQLVTKRNEKTQNWFTNMIIGNAFALFGEISDRVLAGRATQGMFWMHLLLSVVFYYIAVGVLLYAIFCWIYSHIKQREEISEWWKRIAFVFVIAQVAVAVLSHPLKINYIDSNNIYTHGKLFFLAYLFPYVIYMMSLSVFLVHIKAFRKSELVYLGYFLTIPVVCQVCQVTVTKMLIFSPAVTLGLVILILFVQGQREHEQDRQLSAAALGEKEILEKVQKRQEELNGQLIDALCGAVEAKDIYTRGHSLRVAQYAREIMYRMGGDERAQQEVYYIGILHDIGKISVKDEIINKNGRLTDEEYEQIKLHTIAGYQILRGVDMIPDLAIGARWHHERYDGKGYPNGLAGENIPLIARIISVADAYDAMTSNRSYHTIMPQSEVREQIVKGMGTQFDPKIAQIMLDMIDEDLQYDMKQMDYSRVTNILMIDDDSFFHRIVSHALINENFAITFAKCGEEGIELLKENKYDLCLLDMEMPGMNGFDVLEWIQKNVRKLKVIFLTGDKDMASIKRSEELGAVDYITKPINVNVLKESIHSVLTH